MTKMLASDGTRPLTRRKVIAGALETLFASSALSALSTEAFGKGTAWRCVNIMNFIRADEPRQSTDLIRPVQEQMALIK